MSALDNLESIQGLLREVETELCASLAECAALEAHKHGSDTAAGKLGQVHAATTSIGIHIERLRALTRPHTVQPT